MNKKKAEKIYNEILKRMIIPLTGNNTTYSNDLNKIGHSLFGTNFYGVFSSDKIPVLNDLKKYAIINLDKSNEPGSHWVAIAYHKNKLVLYDSFGRKGQIIIPALWKSGNGTKIIDTEYDAEQDKKENNCGARALSFLYFFHKYGIKPSLWI